MRKPRLFVLTDVTSRESGVREPDDAQSLVRLLHYANEFSIEGICATSNLGHGAVCRPEIVVEVLEGYRAVLPNLARFDPTYPSADALIAVVAQGHAEAGPDVPVERCVEDGLVSAAAKLLIDAADRPDARPLWVTVWGGSADLAQALHHVRSTRTPEELEQFLSRLRVIAVHDQDTTGPWIRKEFPALWYWLRTYGVRGMYRSGDASLCTSEWVRAHIHGSGGALAKLYPDYDGGDIFWKTLGPVRGIKEGDTPSWLTLVPNGLCYAECPELGGWGGRGRCVADPEVRDDSAQCGRWYEDAVDTDVQHPDSPDPRLSSVYRWRADFQADFAQRLLIAGGATPGFTSVRDALPDTPPEVTLDMGSKRLLPLDALRPHPKLEFGEASFYPACPAPPGCGVSVHALDSTTLELDAAAGSPATKLSLVLRWALPGESAPRAYSRVTVRLSSPHRAR
jgi:hypothetical protein